MNMNYIFLLKNKMKKGFEDKEIQFFKENNYYAATISNLIYRAETAAISALAGVIYEYEL